VPEIGQIVVEHLPGAAVVALCGEHDVSTVPALRAELDAILATSAKVIVDLSEATFVDSSIVGVLFHAAAPPGRIIAVVAAPGTFPRRLIDMVALTASVPTFDSRDPAMAYATEAEG
jgi:anti-anti-sigma factor